MTIFVRAGLRFNRWLAAALLALPLCAGAATFTVTKTADTNDGACDADCSLREAVVAANAAAGADTIILPAGTYGLTLVGVGEDAAATGDLDISDDSTITGAGAATTIIDGNAADRVVHILGSAASVTISGVTIRNGSGGFGGGITKDGGGLVQLTSAIVTANTATGFGGGINNNNGAAFNIDFTTVSGNNASGFGGGINNNSNGALTVRDSIVANNTTTSFGGGGINNNNVGTLLVVRSVVSGNSAQNGGGINNNFSGNATITETTISANTATGSIGGGGILNNHVGRLDLYQSTVSGNTSAGFGGGGIMSNLTGQLDFQNSTISGNTTTGSIGGGGIYQNNTPSSALLNSVTIANNASTNGGRNIHINTGQTPLTLFNSIVANPASGSNCGGVTPASNGFNLASDASCNLVLAGDVQNANPLLGALANNGGLTQTHALQAGSPTIDTGSPASPTIDQRGVARPVGAGFDKGAFEGTLGGGGLPTLSINSVSQNEGNAGSSILTFTVTLSAASAQTVTVDFATANGTATAGGDYNAVSGTLTFPAGTTTQPIAVTILGDTVPEGNETLAITLSNAANATIAGATGTGSIINDDAAPPTATATAAIPTLSEWTLALLALLLAGIAATSLRRKR